MSDQDDDLDGGDISSGFGVSKKGGPVSDERAEQMLHGRAHQEPGATSFAVDPAGRVTEAGEDAEDAEASESEGGKRPDGGGGGGGGGW